jgi:hypothetical protein
MTGGGSGVGTDSAAPRRVAAAGLSLPDAGDDADDAESSSSGADEDGRPPVADAIARHAASSRADASVHRVARQLAAVFGVGSYAGGVAAADHAAAGDADNLAAVLELLQPDAATVAAASASSFGAADVGEEDFAENAGADAGAAGMHLQPAVLRWVSTLAQHPYFAPLPLGGGAGDPSRSGGGGGAAANGEGQDADMTQQGVMDAFVRYAAPLLAGAAGPAASPGTATAVRGLTLAAAPASPA